MSERTSGKNWTFGRVLAAIISVIAAGGTIFCAAFQKWLTIDLFGTWTASLTVIGFRSAVTQAQERLSTVSSILSQVGITDSILSEEGFASLQRFALIALACLAGVVLLQVIYVVVLLCNKKASRFFGILAGLAALALSAAFLVLVFRENAALLAKVQQINEVLDSLTGDSSLLGSLKELITGSSGGLNVSLPENDIVKFTVYPVITAVLGLVEMITAR